MAWRRMRTLLVARQRAYPVTLQVIDRTESWEISAIGEPKADLTDIKLDCMQPDGTWRTFSWAAGETPAAVPGAGNLRFRSTLESGVFVSNVGTVRGKLFCRLTDDTGTVIFERWSAIEINPSEGWIFPNYEIGEVITFDMPPRPYTITVEVGH